MVRNSFVVEVTDARHERMVTIRLCPINRLLLSPENAENVVCMIFNHVIVNARSFRASLGACFYVNIRHRYLPSDQSYRKTTKIVLQLSGGTLFPESTRTWAFHIIDISPPFLCPTEENMKHTRPGVLNSSEASNPQPARTAEAGLGRPAASPAHSTLFKPKNRGLTRATIYKTNRRERGS
jgi:hypothetical protein